MAKNFPTLTQAIENARTDPKSMSEVTANCYQRIADHNAENHAFIHVTDKEKLSKVVQGSLAGAPIAVKDLYDLKGVPTTAGAKIFDDQPAHKTATAVEKLIHNGAFIIGKTNTHEIALGVTGTNPHYGDVHNPWDKDRIIGGSSSGSTAAVALGMCLAALGTDTGGSIRIPASLAGVVGLKPTFGKVSTSGVIPLSWDLDHPGPIAQTVTDAALMLNIISGFDPVDPNSIDTPQEDYTRDLELGVEGFNFGSLDGEYIRLSEPAVYEAFEQAMKQMISLGATIDPVELDHLRDAAAVNTSMLKTDAAAYHAERLEKHPEKFGADILTRLLEGKEYPSVKYALDRRYQRLTIQRLKIFFQEHDALILPTTPITAPLLHETDPLKQAGLLNRYTAPFNLSGMPAISIPCGFSPEGLPIGLQIVTDKWQEKKLLRIARAFEMATKWHTFFPEM